MNETDEIRDEFSESCFALGHDVIVDIADKTGDVDLHNVIVGLNDECYGLILEKSPDKISYQLFYVNGHRGLNGYLINLKLENENRDTLVFMFANHLTHKYPTLDLIDVFNTYQRQTRSMLEKEGYFTVSSLELEKFNGKDAMLMAPGVKGIIVVPLIDRITFLREYFGNRHSLITDSIENASNPGLVIENNYVYLMLNGRNGLIKIGRSIKPTYREKTLQSEEPEVVLISLWRAPREIEKQLHKLVSSRKKRGEWFALKAADMKAIKERMAEFV